MVEHVIDVLVAGRPAVQVARLQVAADDAYQLAFGEQVPDDAAVLDHGFDTTGPHRLEHGLELHDARRPFDEVHLDVSVAGQSEVRRVVDDERGLVVDREQLVHEAHVNGLGEKKKRGR